MLLRGSVVCICLMMSEAGQLFICLKTICYKLFTSIANFYFGPLHQIKNGYKFFYTPSVKWWALFFQPWSWPWVWILFQIQALKGNFSLSLLDPWAPSYEKAYSLPEGPSGEALRLHRHGDRPSWGQPFKHTGQGLRYVFWRRKITQLGPAQILDF